MPTGYTAKLMEKGQDFRSFVLTCARAMGACIMQRDDSLEVLPEKQKPSDYHVKALADAEKKLAKLKAMSQKKQIEYGEEMRSKAVASAMKSRSKEQEEESRLDKMEAQVRAWNPPTSDHKGLKEFMLQQIATSRHGDWMEKYVREAQDKSPEAYFAGELSSAARDVRYHSEEYEKEIARTNERNAWIDSLYKSLPNR